MINDDLKNIYHFLRFEGLATLHTEWTIAIEVAQIGLEYYRADMLKFAQFQQSRIDTLH